MQRVRLGFLATVAMVGTLVLSGCQHDPDRALQIGDVKIDNAEIEADADWFATKLANLPQPPEDPVGLARRSVVQLTAVNELARRYAREKGITLPEPDYAASAQSLEAPEDDPYVRLHGETSAYLPALLAQATPQTPTEADMREVYDRYAKLAGEQAGSYEDVRAELLKLPQYAQALGLRTELLAAMNQYDLIVNPLYMPLEFPLYALGQQEELVLVDLPIGDQGVPVRDAS